MAGRTCVRNVVEINKTPRVATRNNPKPKGRSGETKEEEEKDEARGQRVLECDGSDRDERRPC